MCILGEQMVFALNEQIFKCCWCGTAVGSAKNCALFLCLPLFIKFVYFTQHIFNNLQSNLFNTALLVINAVLHYLVDVCHLYTPHTCLLVVPNDSGNYVWFSHGFQKYAKMSTA